MSINWEWGVGAAALDEAITLVRRARGDPVDHSPADAAPRSHPDCALPPTSEPPAAVADTGRKLPARTGRLSPTTGEFNGERITSAEDEASVADLQPFPGGGWPSAIISHVESHVAARMRRQNLTEGTVVLNNITCGNRGFDNGWPATCEVYLRSILPRDARLIVWASQDGGRTWWTKTYVGTGERIR